MASADHTTSPETAQHATQSAPIERFALLGIFGTDANPGALLRLPDGTTRKIALGDTTDHGQVIAIDESSVILQEGSQTHTLRLPAT